MEREKNYPLSDYQLGIFIDCQTDSQSTAYNLPYLFTLPSGCDLERIERAIESLFSAHPALLARIVKSQGSAVQRVSASDRVNISRKKMADEELESYLLQFVKPFELFDSPLYKIEIITTPSHSYLLFDFFHIIFDGGSVVKFISELDAAYCGRELEAERVSVLDHSLEQTLSRGGESWNRAEAYFDRALQGAETTDFAGDNPTKENKSKGQRIDIEISKEQTGDIRALGFTPNQLFNAATAVALSRICRTEKVTHVTLHHGRTDEDRKRNMGYYVRTLPITINIPKNIRVRELIDSVSAAQRELFENVEYPLIAINRKHSITPNFYYTYQGLVNEEYSLDGKALKMRYLPIDQHGISVMIYDKQGRYELRVVYDNELYTERRAIALAECVKCCAIDMLSDLDKAVSQVKLVADPTTLLNIAAGETIDYDTTKSFVDLFLDQVRNNPNNIAVADELSTLSYQQLDNDSNSLAATLIEAGIKPNTFVGVMMPRAKEYMTAVVAIWKAGAAYLPLDSEYPLDRLQYMVEDSRSNVLITTQAMNCQLEAQTVICLDRYTYTESQPINLSKPDNLAYMIYTSGSTGKPKGVMIQHQSLTCFIESIIALYTLTAEDKICCHSSFSFDASVEDLYPVLAVGGEMHILSPAMRFDMRALNNYITQKGITGGCYTTQFGVEFISQFNPKVRYLTVGGEKMDKAPVCDTVIYNTYGPTEFTVDATYFIVDNGKQYRNIPIGRPLPNAHAYIMDSYGNLMPRDFAGELCMAGTQTAKGYWQREELTKEKFLPDPFNPKQMLYRTGDLVRWNDNGDIEYLGRIDSQIKLRGFRIELGEIESRLSSYQGILSSCVEVRKIGSVEHLCAYYTASEQIDIVALKQYLAASLTHYMVPTVYIPLDTMPLTPNGKVNRKALPTPVLERDIEYVAPETETERQICSIFGTELKSNQVGVTDDFFEMGGSSLLAISLLIKLENKGYKIAYGDLFKLKTPRKIAQFIDSGSDDQDKTSDFPINDYDYTAINNMLTKQRTEWFDGFQTKPIGNVLLTGAAGYLGAHLLYDLVKNTDSKIYCLLRAKKDISVNMRLKTISMYYFGETFEELYGSRIFTIEGDITDTDIATKVAAHIDTVINSAALVKHYEAGNEMEKINFYAVENLARYCLSMGAQLIHISTYSTAGVSVNGSVDSGKLFRESDLYIGQSHALKYTWTKFLAERSILEMVATSGLRAKIMRVGNLMGRASDGEFQANFHANAFVNGLRAYKVIGAFPLKRMVEKSEESPIDSVARAIVLLSTTPNDVVVLHPYNCYEHDMGAIIEAMRECGYPIEVSSDELFASRFEALMNDPQKSAMLSGILHSSSSKTVQYIGAENNRTTTILYRLGFHWPQPDGQYIKRLIGVLDGMSFFDEV